MLKQMQVVAREAGEIIMRFRRAGDFSVIQKEDASPVTSADLAASEFICANLENKFSIPVVSEEREVAYEERSGWREFFVVDPLDGTKDFISGRDEFTVNIGLVRDRRPVLGVVYVPARNEMFFGEVGCGAFWRLGDDPEVRLPSELCAEPTVARYWGQDSPNLLRFMELNGIGKTITVGSAIRLPRLAQGRFNVYPGYSGSKEWDTAAGEVLLLESGGAMMDLTTRRAMEYNRPTMENNPFLAVGKGLRLDGFSLP